MARLTLEFPEDQYCYSTQLTVRAVSYTHLDVYKRQLQSLSPAFRLEGGAASLSKNLAGGEVFLV